MPVVRIYLPLGRADLVELDERRELTVSGAGARTAYRVTRVLELAEPGLDVEAREYAAFGEAVADAVMHRAAAGGLVVAAADVDPAWLVDIDPGGGGRSRCSVHLVTTLPVARVASFHVDGGEPAGSDDPPDAGDLLWYDVTELTEVLALLP